MIKQRTNRKSITLPTPRPRRLLSLALVLSLLALAAPTPAWGPVAASCPAHTAAATENDNGIVVEPSRTVCGAAPDSDCSPPPECGPGEVFVNLGSLTRAAFSYTTVRVHAPPDSTFTSGRIVNTYAAGDLSSSNRNLSSLRVRSDAGGVWKHSLITWQRDCNYRRLSAASGWNINSIVSGQTVFEVGGRATYNSLITCDGGRISATMCIALETTKISPTAVDDIAETTVNTPVEIDVAHNDLPGENPLDLDSVTVIAQPEHGTAMAGTGGIVTYTPAPGYYGVDAFEYEIRDTENLPDTASVTVTVHAIPIAADDAAETGPEIPVAIDVLQNDTHHDPDGQLDPSSLQVVSGPGHGTTQVAPGGVITYTPESGFFGEDWFEYEIADTMGITDTAGVTISVMGPPVVESIYPRSVVMRAKSFELTVRGQYFRPSAVVVWTVNPSTELQTTFVSSTTLTATVDEDLVATTDEDDEVSITVNDTENNYTSNSGGFTVQPPELWISPGGQEIAIETDPMATADVTATVNEMYGIQLVLAFDPSMVRVLAVEPGHAWTGRSYTLLEAEADNETGIVRFAAYLKRPGRPISREEAKIITLDLEAQALGETVLELQDVIVSDIDGIEPLPLKTEDGRIWIRGESCLSGVIELQGRTDRSGATIVLAGGRAGTLTAVTDVAGEWSVCEIIADTYNLTVEMPGYLSAAWPGLEIGAAGAELDPTRLLAGDCDNNDEIDIFDAAILGAAFDSSPPLDARADLNDDGVVNILDAALLSGNWGLEGPLTW